MNGTELKTELKRAGRTQVWLASKLGHGRGMVADWVSNNRVPPEWEPLVREALGMPAESTSPLDGFSDEDLLTELLARAKRRPGR